MTRTCANCGAGIGIARADARFCSGRCRVASHRRKHAAPAFPAEMTDTPRWTRARGKRPFSVDGYAASSTDPDTWSWHSEVVASDVGDSIGVMLGSGLGCWDLDHCLNDGQLTDDAREIIASIKVPVLFVEVSMSGTGLHIFTAEPEGKSNQGNWGGHYLHSRFIRVTGNRFDL